MKAHEQLKAWLKARGSSQIWLADQIGARHEVVNRWIAGKVIPIPVFRKALADLTGLDIAGKEAWE